MATVQEQGLHERRLLIDCGKSLRRTELLQKSKRDRGTVFGGYGQENE